MSKNYFPNNKNRIKAQKLNITTLIILQHSEFPVLLIFLAQFSCSSITLHMLYLDFHRA